MTEDILSNDLVYHIRYLPLKYSSHTLFSQKILYISLFGCLLQSRVTLISFRSRLPKTHNLVKKYKNEKRDDMKQFLLKVNSFANKPLEHCTCHVFESSFYTINWYREKNTHNFFLALICSRYQVEVWNLFFLAYLILLLGWPESSVDWLYKLQLADIIIADIADDKKWKII